MSPKLYRSLVWMAIVGLTGLLAVQVIWFYKAYALQEKQFDQRVNLSLRAVADKILKSSGNLSANIPPVSKLAENAYFVTIETPFTYQELDRSIRTEFRSAEIQAPFELTLFDAGKTIVLGGLYKKGVDSADPSCTTREASIPPVNFSVTFPNKSAAIVGELNIWVFSAGTFLVILILFGWLIRDLSKQKNLAQMKNDFINNMTHELQTPVTNISMASEVLALKNVDKEKRERYLEIIRQETARMKHQVDRVLTAAAMEKNEFVLTKSRVDLHELLSEVISNFHLRTENRHGKIESRFNASRPMIDGDRFQLANVFYNLLDNAEKYCDQSPVITISTKDYRDGITVSVEDNGIGIAEDAQKLIFEKFYRASSGNVHDVKGFGLGLTYVRNIVSAHNAIITVSSRISKGSRFEISFPAVG